jgi:putative transposase
VSALYLRGISTSQMADALGPILGSEAGGLSSTSVSRLAEQWYGEYQAWQQRDLSQEHLVYIWVDGIYTQVRLQDTRPCLLVIVGARADGTKTLVALADGERESKESWAAVLRDLQRRGLKRPPKLAVGDGALGFWAALDEVWPSCQRQRCWWHKSGNVLNYLPKKLQAQARTHLHEIWQACTLKDANEAFDAFVSIYEDKYPKATRCLAKDRESLLAFYGFPAAHWRHLRTTNPIESSFATIRHRHRQTKGNGSRQATIAMLFQLGRLCEKGWRKLNGHAILADVIEGVVFRDGIKTDEKITAA